MENSILDILVDLCEDEIVRTNKDIDLFESGLMDSMTFVELLVQIEDGLGVSLAPSEVTRDEMNTPNKIIAKVTSKMQ